MTKDHDTITTLKDRLRTIGDLGSIGAVLGWDQATYMPKAAGADRGRQQATLSRIIHELATAPELGDAIEAAAEAVAGQDPDDADVCLVRVARRDYAMATRIPTALVARITEHTTRSFTEWEKARPDNDFATMRPILEQTVELSREIASCFPGKEHPADALIDISDEGMTAERVRTLFAELRERLVPLVAAIAERPIPDDSCLKGTFPADKQRAFGEHVIGGLGFDFDRGRQDRSAHPFMTSFGIDDVRITTRFDEGDLRSGLFGTIHEAGHAMYEQGINRAFAGTPLAGGVSSGVHESQSRLWENIVGRSLPFWSHFYPALREAFPGALDDTSLEDFHRAVNRVEPSLIRVEADEVTYNLHVMMRVDFALAMLEGDLQVADLPDAWNERMRSDLGVTPDSDSNGVLQDVHWYFGLVGGSFHGYTLGNVIAAQIWEAALRDLPDAMNEASAGRFDGLRGWLRENVHQHGRTIPPEALVERATGSPLGHEPYVRYLEQKYGDLYGL